MSLKLKPSDTFKTRIDVVLADGTEGDFSAEFKYYDRPQLDELLAQKLPDCEFVESVLVGVTGIQGEDGQNLDFATALPMIQRDIALTGATVQGFLKALGGAPAKNSRKSLSR
ncbi:hypothetical protein [Dyella sp. 20L07]|uniref:hypothetical protein n=1 Tax=Dyella sp. 20L07 TaxID=3384240 RepID=UPI003D2BB733